jgi:hypothetical protein
MPVRLDAPDGVVNLLAALLAAALRRQIPGKTDIVTGGYADYGSALAVGRAHGWTKASEGRPQNHVARPDRRTHGGVAGAEAGGDALAAVGGGPVHLPTTSSLR